MWIPSCCCICCTALRRVSPGRLSALHVHHGISPNADTWADFCAGLCAGHAISRCKSSMSTSRRCATHGIEAAARKLRHVAFARQACDFVALAHHADDQAETLLLQLLRGSGVRGASAMPVLALPKRPWSSNATAAHLSARRCCTAPAARFSTMPQRRRCDG